MRLIKSRFIKKYQAFIRFIIVGIINTLNYYTLYIILMYFNNPYIISHTLTF